jgi:tetratricopeptide (TPR) repeat protein
MPKRPKFDAAEAEAYLEFLAAMEEDPSKVSGVGRSKSERQMLAHESLCAAEDADNPLEMLRNALRAVRLDPACIDARLMLLQFTAGPTEEKIEELEQIVALGEAELGKEFFAENTGYFWLAMESRPYMRARGMLAQALHGVGRLDDSIDHVEAMLRLNPNDNQGLRYGLLGSYLETGRLEAVRKLFTQYDEESAIFLWARVLERYLAAELTEAATILTKARKENTHVEDLLTKRRKPPKESAPYYSPGDVTEAVVCLESIGAAWNRYPEALAWLAKQSPAARPKAKAAVKQMRTGPQRVR